MDGSAAASRPARVPPRAGVGLKPQHFGAILGTRPDLGFFEIHAENYMGAGGPMHHYLGRIRADYPLSLHGVGLSIGGEGPLDRDHLARLRRLADRYEPGLFSEHLAWSTHEGTYFNDLLPLPYTEAVLARVCSHVAQVQETLGRRMLLENPSTYLALADSTIPETEFLAEIAARTGCGLLLDVNNVMVSAVNHATSAEEYLDAFPLGAVGEIHLAGHAPDSDAQGRPLLIDSHDRPVADPVWGLFERVVARTGPLPVLIEWDAQVPGWPALHAQAREAEARMAAAGADAR